MASSNQSVECLTNHVKKWSCCDKSKIINDFIQQSKEGLKEFSHCNTFANKKKGKSVNVKNKKTTYLESLSLADVFDDDNTEEIIVSNNKTLYDLVNLESVIANSFIDVEEVYFLETFRLKD
ncbi:427_t:CDS:1 [Cetraspora pellucida]|uniref:427_t:CDS:1 n=1 Tax=Cetraspora pellucida TaxID=1433469 RepID=A0ACA9LWX9_9GLOM|nr:427_t:CDS:1 [Cetraspora pellucida]